MVRVTNSVLSPLPYRSNKSPSWRTSITCWTLVRYPTSSSLMRNRRSVKRWDRWTGKCTSALCCFLSCGNILQQTLSHNSPPFYIGIQAVLTVYILMSLVTPYTFAAVEVEKPVFLLTSCNCVNASVWNECVWSTWVCVVAPVLGALSHGDHGNCTY